MEERTNTRTYFFKDALKSIKDLDKYEDFALEIPKNAMKYFLKLLLIFCVIISFFYTCRIIQNLNEIYGNIKAILPDFTFSQGKLEMQAEQPIVIEDYKESIGKIIIDTQEDEDIIEKYADEKNGIIFLKDKLIILSNNSLGQVSYSYQTLATSYQLEKFTKQDAIQYIEGINKLSLYSSIYFVIFVYLWIIYFISILIDILLLSALAWIIARVSRMKLKYAPAFGIAIHAITLPLLLNLIYIIINLLTGFRIQYFQLMYNTISYIYVIVAILMIKTDFINRQMELMKLAEEQEKIREELKKQEEEEKEKKKEENKKPEEKKEEKPETTNKKKKPKKEEKGVGADAPACEETGK